MRKTGLMVCLIATSVIWTSEANAQLLRHHARNTRPIYNSGFDAEGMTTTNEVGRVGPINSLALGMHDKFSPNPVYAYSNRGIDAGLTHTWNQQQAMSQPWHANYQYWRYAEPTALVVPPTAAYQTSYGWGVGQTRSYPIHHQFGMGTAGTPGNGQGGSYPMPYWPSHTDQMGVYSVRAPW